MSDTVTVEVAQGTLRGRKINSKCKGTFYSFQGVPYAKPPVGPLRFKDAQPVEPWPGIRDALQEGNISLQLDGESKQLRGSEDCLYLNVYSPQLPKSGTDNLRLPVMVYFHGGGFAYGSASATDYGADYLVDQGVVLVTVNYRLGILGFLCLNDPVAPGNAGLKDQVVALRWVQKNIAKFGGDPNNVTIFGESAGGSSVQMHMLSPMSKGLFCRAIAQSGAGFNPWSFERHPREAAFRVGAALGFSGNQPKELVEFLRGVDYLTLGRAALDHGISQEDKQRILVFAFTPTLEIEVEGVERFLPASSLELLESGLYDGVPYMTGVTKDEGLIAWQFADLKNPETLTRIDNNFGRVVLPDTRLPENYSKKDQAVSKLRHYFLKDKPLTEKTLPGFIDMCSDLWFSEQVETTVKKMAKLAKAPLYYYQFSFDGSFNTCKVKGNLPAPGVWHLDELGYLFSTTAIETRAIPDPASVLTRSRMLKLWTNFAKTGNPTPKDDPLLPVKWEPYTSTSPCYLEINEELSMKKHMFKERMQFWEEFYRKSLTS
ncbi:esterase FE4 [Anabrus simplex]|uniref:esterase FE4 n=1 Tax=Anabrus simplex TaxID=316456 RepID=UPI0035A39215